MPIIRSGDFQEQQLWCIISAVPVAKPLALKLSWETNLYSIAKVIHSFIYRIISLFAVFAQFLLFSQDKAAFFFMKGNVST